MATWTWVLADQYGSALAELWRASGRQLTYSRNTYAEASCVIRHDDDDASLLFDALTRGTPTLQAYRNGTLRFNGYLAPLSEDLEEEATASLVFRSPFARHLGDGSSRGRFTGASVPFTATDAGAIGKALIDATNSADGPTGLETTGAIETTVARDRTYNYANVGQSIVNLSNVINGFDFGEDFILGGQTLAQFRVYASQGQPRPLARFEYGADTLNNVAGVQRTIEAPVNAVTVLGVNGLVATATDAGSRTLWGTYPMFITLSDVTVQATLDARAAALIRPNPVKTINFTPDPALAPLPWDDYFLGDSVSFFGRRKAFVESSSVRVNSFTVAIDDDGNEAAEISDPLTPDEEATIKAQLSVEVTS